MKLTEWFRDRKERRQARKEGKVQELRPLTAPDDPPPPETRYTPEYETYLAQMEAEQRRDVGELSPERQAPEPEPAPEEESPETEVPEEESPEEDPVPAVDPDPEN